MAKYVPALLDDPIPPRLDRRARALIAACLLLGVPVFEETKVVFSRWMSFFGTPTHVETPLLDFLGSGVRLLSFTVHRHVSGLFRDPAWPVGPTVMIASLWVVVLAYLLRGTNR